jgi:hypothetical protein
MTLIILNINFISKLCNMNRFANSTIQENFDKNTIILFIKIMNKLFGICLQMLRDCLNKNDYSNI